VKIKRFVAKDMRTALVDIKEELGADAVIMSQKKIPEGVELMAAVDYNQPNQASAKQKIPAEQVSSSSRNIDNDVVSIGQRNQTPQNVQAKQNVQQEQSANAPMQSMTSQLLHESETAPADSLSALLNRKVQQEQKAANFKASNQASNNTSANDIEQQFKSFTERLEQSTAIGHNTNVGQSPLNDQQNKQQNNVARASQAHASELTPSMSQQRAQQTNNQVSHQTSHQNIPNTESVRQNNVASDEIEKMRQEMLSIRQLLEHQVSGLMWQDMAQKDPSKALMVNRLMSIGLNEQVAEQIAGYIPSFTNEQEGWQQAKDLLVQQLNTTNNDIIHRGGVVSLVGPTGVGKTTTIAKLAARFAQIHGADQVVMISTDNYRIAGFEQLATYGRIIGCQVKLAKDAESLDALLQQYGQKKLVLIDTAGMGQRDMRLAEHLTTLIANSRVRIRNYLVLAANTQQRVMQENVDRFKKVPLAGCIYTKLDESLSVGEIIATSIQNGLAIGYLTDGQRVPEDIKVANAEKLVTLADRLAGKVNKQNFTRPMPMTSAAVGY